MMIFISLQINASTFVSDGETVKLYFFSAIPLNSRVALMHEYILNLILSHIDYNNIIITDLYRKKVNKTET